MATNTKTVNNVKRPSGINIYVDEKGRDVYYDVFTKRGYVIQEKNRATYSKFENRYLLCLILIILLCSITNNYVLSIIIGVVVAIIYEVAFRFKFLETLVAINNFKPKEKYSIIDQIANSNQKQKTIIKAILYVALAVLIIINAYRQHLSTPLMILSYLVSVFGVASAVINTIALTKMK